MAPHSEHLKEVLEKKIKKIDEADTQKLIFGGFLLPSQKQKGSFNQTVRRDGGMEEREREKVMNGRQGREMKDGKGRRMMKVLERGDE